MRMLRGNFLLAIRTAIEDREEWEKQAGYKSPSAYLDGLRQVAEAAERGERIEIAD